MNRNMLRAATITFLISLITQHQQPVSESASFLELLENQSEIYSDAPNSFLEFQKSRSTGIGGVNAAWRQFARSKMEDRDVGRFLGFVEGRLAVSIPPKFSELFIKSQQTSIGGVQPNKIAWPSVPKYFSKPQSVSFDLKKNGEVVTIVPPESKVNGKLIFYSDGAAKFEQELWAPSAHTINRSGNTSISIEVTESGGGESLYVFGADIACFYIIEFEKETGSRKGTFISSK